MFSRVLRGAGMASLSAMRIRVAFLALLVVATGTGCGVEPTPTPTPTTTATSPAALEPPLPALPLACGDLVSPSTLAAFAGAEVPVRLDALDTPNSWYDVAKRQRQILTCEWASDRDLAPLSLLAIPDAAAEFAEYRASLVPNAYDHFDAAGDESVHQCAYGQCRFDLLVGEFWISGFGNNLPMMDEADLEPLFVPILSEIAAAAEAALADTRDAWEPPAGVLAGWGPDCSGEAPIAELAAALGFPGGEPRRELEREPGAWGLVSQRIAVSQCVFVDPATGSPVGGVGVLEAGGWVADEWSIQPPAQWDSGYYEPVDVDGIGVVYIGDDGTTWDAYILVDRSLVWVWIYGDTRDGFLEKLAAATAVVRS
jgi:hypothetical protein